MTEHVIRDHSIRKLEPLQIIFYPTAEKFERIIYNHQLDRSTLFQLSKKRWGSRTDPTFQYIKWCPVTCPEVFQSKRTRKAQFCFTFWAATCHIWAPTRPRQAKRWSNFDRARIEARAKKGGGGGWGEKETQGRSHASLRKAPKSPRFAILSNRNDKRRAVRQVYVYFGLK